MIPPSFQIEPDAENEFLRLTLVGDWDMDITARFAAEVGTALMAMVAQGARHGEFRTLVDMRRKTLLPQTVAAEFAKMVRPDSPSKRIALLVSGAIHRLQAKRIANERQAVFMSEADALAWLMEGDREAATA